MGTSNLHFKIKEATNVISNGWEVLVDNQTAQLELACFDTVLNKLLQYSVVHDFIYQEEVLFRLILNNEWCWDFYTDHFNINYILDTVRIMII